MNIAFVAAYGAQITEVGEEKNIIIFGVTRHFPFPLFVH
jgi:hypothetical protein